MERESVCVPCRNKRLGIYNESYAYAILNLRERGGGVKCVGGRKE